ncbi:MAG: tetraacyldisaccharide 4'-kinase [Candidatus Cloacimonadaceae bacterium]|nr:tetraacyldisaccharide 4'-kinase [Candidatus Cloacimonadaceae bacterium]
MKRSGLSYLLSPLSFLNAFMQTWRRKLIRIGAFQAPCFVISIGNITSGGSGKTPLTIHLAKALTGKGFKVAVSHRGYKGGFEHSPHLISDEDSLLYPASLCGDEAYLIASRLKGIPVAVGRDRKAAISLILGSHPDTQIVIMDDGFQHLKVRRNIDIACFDADTGIGNGLLIPAGYLREPLSALRDAQIIVINRKHPDADISALNSHLRLLGGDIYTCDYRITMGRDFEGNPIPLELIKNKRCILVSGIANPDSLTKSVHSLGIDIREHFAFPDHYSYSGQSSVSDIITYCKDNSIERIVCTEKDIMKLSRHQDIQALLTALVLDLACDDDAALMEDIMKRIENVRVS